MGMHWIPACSCWPLGVYRKSLHCLQGIVGSTPWNAMVFFTLWLQLLGFSDYSASLLMAIFAGGCALGSALGGFLGMGCLLGVGFRCRVAC